MLISIMSKRLGFPTSLKHIVWRQYLDPDVFGPINLKFSSWTLPFFKSQILDWIISCSNQTIGGSSCVYHRSQEDQKLFHRSRQATISVQINAMPLKTHSLSEPPIDEEISAPPNRNDGGSDFPHWKLATDLFVQLGLPIQVTGEGHSQGGKQHWRDQVGVFRRLQKLWFWG